MREKLDKGVQNGRTVKIMSSTYSSGITIREPLRAINIYGSVELHEKL